MKKGSVITIITLISRPIGYVREMIQAYLFGATLLVDAFVIAFNFPELIQTLFFSGATSAFLIPVCTRYLNNDEEYSKIYSTFMNMAIIITIFLSLFFLVFSKVITHIIAPGFSPEGKEITMYLFIIMIPVITLHTLLSVIKEFLNAKEHFAAPELSGIVWNVFFIASALILSKKLGIYSLAIGVSAGAFLQIIMQYPYLKRYKIRYSAIMDMHHPAVLSKKGFSRAPSSPLQSFPSTLYRTDHRSYLLMAGGIPTYAFRIVILPFVSSRSR